MFSKSKKLISMLIVFVIVFSYMGETLYAVATTDALSAITNGFFKNTEMQFSSYFVKGEESSTDNVFDVNQKATLFFEVAPSQVGQGFLKEGSIVASDLSENGINFKFAQIKNVQTDEPESIIQDAEEIEENVVEPENVVENEIAEENVVEPENVIENETAEENVVEPENAIENETAEENVVEPENVIENEIAEENVVEPENIIENETSEENVVEPENIIENETAEENVVEPENIIENEASEENVVIQEVVSRSSESRTAENIENSNVISEENAEEFVDENKVIEELTGESYEELTAEDFEIAVVSENEIKIQNVIYNTIIEVEIEYNSKEELNIADLYQQINLKLTGTYINIDLEKIEIENNKTINVGWSYTKDFEISGEYKQFSPFELGETKGIIVENKINVKREIEDENYLPIKQTKVEIEVPEYNGKLPETVNVQATKLMATKGQDSGNVLFTDNNWFYDVENKKITIIVNNENEGKAIKTFGEDEFIVIYRYNNYTQDEIVTMENDFKVTVEEYSANNNVLTSKEFKETQEVKVKHNDLITYNIGSTEEKLNIAKINANYNSEESVYETEFTTTVNVNVLTSDLLEEFKINSSKDIYVDGLSNEYDATADIYYNKVKFNYSEIANMIENGANIEIQNLAGQVLHILNADSVENQDSCEVRLEGKEKGILVVFKNVTLNGNVSIEFTKAIGKSSYDKAVFNSFKSIKNYVSAELKYRNNDERFAMDEIVASKQISNSKTVAEIRLSNNNLSTIAPNEGVELRIALNNDKLDTDLYINPHFELVFPKYVKDVIVEDISLMNDCGLQIENCQIYTENDIVKMKINLVGTQTTFSQSVLTDGTNILLKLNIKLNEYTPRIQDQIKMYYYNQGMTNYESQTKWTINEAIPTGIFRETNGFDVAVINYQAPKGMITSNAIINYDGQASKVVSVNHGEKVAEISSNKASQIATMELVAMNNTENKCTDVVFVGRIPFKGNRSVVTNGELGTTATAQMLSEIKENIQNVNMATIYYSTNENATKDLSNAENAWTTNVINWQNVKSYMIVVKGEVAQGAVFKYTYDFEIPEGLGYEETLYGSFGGFYNNNLKSEVRYESTEADKVGLKVEEEPEVKVTVKPFGENKNIYYGQILTLVAKVENNTNQDIENAVLKVSVPRGTVYTEVSYPENSNTPGYHQKYTDYENTKEKEFIIERLGSGDITTFQFDVKVLNSEENSIKLTGTTNLLENEQHYQFKAEKGKINVYSTILGYASKLVNGKIVEFIVDVENTSDEEINDANLMFRLPDYLKLKSVKLLKDSKVERSLKYNTQNRITTVDIGNISNQGTQIYLICELENFNVKNADIETMFSVYQDSNSNKIYNSNLLRFWAKKQYIEVNQYINQNEFNYKDKFEYRIEIKNNDEFETSVNVISKLAQNIFVENLKVIVDGNEKEGITTNNISQIEKLTPYGTITIVATGTVYDWGDKNEELNLTNIVKVMTDSGELFKSNEMKVKINKVENKESSNNYSISGNITVISDETQEVKSLGDVQVELQKDSEIISTQISDSIGNYTFKNLEPGSYSVKFNYNDKQYTVSENSVNIVELEDCTAVTNVINITDFSIENVNLSLVEKENFDLSMKQYINKAIVIIDGKEKEYDYENLELAKLEIEPNKLEDAIVKFEYTLEVENTGNVPGQVTSIVDYVPAGLTFDQEENIIWSKGVNGNLYTDVLKGVELLPGENAEITLVLSQKMTEDNTGVISNKAQIAYTESSTRCIEAKENNFATQETIVSVTQGKGSNAHVIITIGIIGVIGMFAFMVKTGRIEISVNISKGIKKIYK